jgi:hypothetical protein
VEVGSHGSPDRRAHWVELGPLWIRARIDGLEGEGPARAFLTYRDLRRATASGAWASARQRSAGLRRATEIVPQHDPDQAEMLTGLSLAEANLLAGDARGRLPTQKELDLVLDRMPQLRTAGVCLWTSSVYGLFDYSHCRFNLARARWESDDTIRLPVARATGDGNAAGGAMQVLIELRSGQTIRHVAPPHARDVAGAQGARLGAAALVVMLSPPPQAEAA